jgi:hypothetical protein
VRETFLHGAAAGHTWDRLGVLGGRQTGACKGAWEALVACAGDFLC